MKQLYEILSEYDSLNYYPLHMPGHKRKEATSPFGTIYAMDITEIEGFDNLHHANDVIQKAQERAAELYHSLETYFLVNGSTCGILAAIAASVSVGGKLLMARNSHKAAYNAVYLRQLKATYLYPSVLEEYSIFGGIAPEEVEKALEEDSEIEAVFITSPTMDGIVSDVEKIAEICHKCGKALIVDEAHGAHFGMHPFLPENSIKKGADIVIHSLHKTLPSFTQTALLHRNGTIANKEKIKEFLAIYQTSSPSYLLMGSMDYCIHKIKQEKNALYEKMKENLLFFQKKVQGLSHIRIMNHAIIGKTNIIAVDPGKLVISVKDTTLTGQALYDTLIKHYFIQPEMAGVDYVLAIVTPNDTLEGYERLAKALLTIDAEINFCKEKLVYEKGKKPEKAIFTIYEAKVKTTKKKRIEDSIGYISAEFVYLYPPGVPILIPGEMITEYIRNQILSYKQQGLPVQGTQDIHVEEISIIQ